jgi:hypothetical protein
MQIVAIAVPAVIICLSIVRKGNEEFQVEKKRLEVICQSSNPKAYSSSRSFEPKIDCGVL